jgi:hypothetical protein
MYTVDANITQKDNAKAVGNLMQDHTILRSAIVYLLIDD